MRISGQLPLHIASAYGVARPHAPQKSAAPIPISTARPIPSASSVDRINSELNIRRPAAIDHLVAASVNTPIRFDGAATAPTAAGSPLQLYTRAADRLDAAVNLNINLGNAIDVTG